MLSESVDGRHLGMIRITGELIKHWLLTADREGILLHKENGIPEDATFVRMAIDWNHGNQDLCIVYEHPSFPLVKRGHAILRLDYIPTYTCCNLIQTLNDIEDGLYSIEQVRVICRLPPRSPST